MYQTTIHKISILAVLLVFSIQSNSQVKRDTLVAKVDDIDIIIDYSRPSLKNKSISNPWVNGKIWRTGADKATTIEVSDDVLVNGKLLTKGKYSFFSIPNKKEWTLIFNKEEDQWGTFTYDKGDNALVVNAKSKTNQNYMDQFTIDVDNGKGTLAWEETQVNFDFSKPPIGFVQSFNMVEESTSNYGILSILVDPNDIRPQLYVDDLYIGNISKFENEMRLRAEKSFKIKLVYLGKTFCDLDVTLNKQQYLTKKCHYENKK